MIHVEQRRRRKAGMCFDEYRSKLSRPCLAATRKAALRYPAWAFPLTWARVQAIRHSALLMTGDGDSYTPPALLPDAPARRSLDAGLVFAGTQLSFARHPMDGREPDA